MSYITCNASENDVSMRSFNKDIKPIIVGLRTVVLNEAVNAQLISNYPKEQMGNTGAVILNSSDLVKTKTMLSKELAKAAIKQSTASSFYSNSDDISILAEKNVYTDTGVDTFMRNVLSAVITPVYPAIQSNLYNMLTETKTVGVNQSAEFDIPSNEAFKWSKGGHGFSSYAHQESYADTVVLNPKPVGTKFDFTWLKLASGEYDLGNDLFRAMLGFSGYTHSLMVRELMAGIAKLVGTSYHAPSFSHANFVNTKNAVKTANGGVGNVWCFGGEVALSKILPSNANMIFGIGEEWVKMGRLDMYARTPLIEIMDTFVPGTYAGNNPVSPMKNDTIYLFSSNGKIIKQAIGKGMASITQLAAQKTNRVTSYEMEIEQDMAIVTGQKFGAIEGV